MKTHIFNDKFTKTFWKTQKIIQINYKKLKITLRAIKTKHGRHIDGQVYPQGGKFCSHNKLEQAYHTS